MRSWLIDIRRLKGMTQKDVASRARITTVHYHYIECGERNPSARVAQRIAAVLGFDWTLFFPEERDERKRA